MDYFNEKKLQAVKDNKLAIETAFILDKEKRKATEEEQTILSKYSGYSCVARLLENQALSICLHSEYTFVDNLLDSDKEYSSDYMNLISETKKTLAETQDMIKKYSKSKQESNLYIKNMEKDRFVSFTTPPELVQTMVDVFQENNITVNSFLDPSAGMGIFAQEFKNLATKTPKFINLESDPLMAKITKHYQPESKFLNQSFLDWDHEKMKFDVTASTIPFHESIQHFSTLNDVEMFRNLNTYFLEKGLASVKNGGIIAYICLSDIIDDCYKEENRKILMENSNLISAVRLPHNTFSGFESFVYNFDLIILQKNIGKQQLTEREEAFVRNERSEDSYNSKNEFFKDSKDVIFTDIRLARGLDGNPVNIFTHKGGITGIASDVKKILQRDFKLFNKDLYTMTQEDLQKTHKEAPKKKKPRHS